MGVVSLDGEVRRRTVGEPPDDVWTTFARLPCVRPGQSHGAHDVDAGVELGSTTDFRTVDLGGDGNTTSGLDCPRSACRGHW